MVSQNNHRMKQQWLLATNQVFSLRNSSIGFVSVVLGLFFLVERMLLVTRLLLANDQ